MSETESQRRTPARELFLGIAAYPRRGRRDYAHRMGDAPARAGTGFARRGSAGGANRHSAVGVAHRGACAVKRGDSNEGAIGRIDRLEHLRRLIELEHDRNVAAIATAKLRLDESFRRYSGRVPQFIEALNSLPRESAAGQDPDSGQIAERQRDAAGGGKALCGERRPARQIAQRRRARWSRDSSATLRPTAKSSSPRPGRPSICRTRPSHPWRRTWTCCWPISPVSSGGSSDRRPSRCRPAA